MQRRNFYQLSAIVSQNGIYYHAYTMSCEAERDGRWIDCYLCDALRDCFCDLANWLYRQIESSHDYLISDECVVETIEVNEYDFTEDGERA